MIMTKIRKGHKKMGIGTRIKELRKKVKMTQPELAEKIGVHETTIRRWEQEKDRGPDTKAVNAIAEALETTPEYLLTETKQIDADEESAEKTLIYEWGGTNRLTLPNTPETRELFKQLVMCAMSSGSKAVTA